MQTFPCSAVGAQKNIKLNSLILEMFLCRVENRMDFSFLHSILFFVAVRSYYTSSADDRGFTDRLYPIDPLYH